MPKKTLGNLDQREKGKTFLREWRKSAGLSQEQAADAIGIERSYLSRIERGENGYSQEILESAAEVYGCRPQDLLAAPPPSEGRQSGSRALSETNAARSKYLASLARQIESSQETPQPGTPLLAPPPALSAAPKGRKKSGSSNLSKSPPKPSDS